MTRTPKAPRSHRKKEPWIVLVGPDGVGKTTVSLALISELNAKYTHFLPRWRFSEPTDASSGKRTVSASRGPFFSFWVLLFRVVYAWLFYWLRILPVTRTTPIISDRWILGYMADPLPLKHTLPEHITELMLGLTPQPDLVVLLSGEPGVVVSRKPELSPEQVSVVQHCYRRLVSWFNLFECDTTEMSPGEVKTQILDQLKSPTICGFSPPRRGAQWLITKASKPALSLPFSPRAQGAASIWYQLSKCLPPLNRKVPIYPPSLPHKWRSQLEDERYHLKGIYLPETGSGRDRESWFYGSTGSDRLVQIKIRRGPDAEEALSRESRALSLLNKEGNDDFLFPEHLDQIDIPCGSCLLIRTRLSEATGRKTLTTEQLIRLTGKIQQLSPGRQDSRTLSHGDLTPWNAWSSPQGVFVLDWEQFGAYRGAAYDAIYYMVSLEHAKLSGVTLNTLLEHYSREQIRSALEEMRGVAPTGYHPIVSQALSRLNESS